MTAGFSEEGCQHVWWRTEKQPARCSVKRAAQRKLRFNVKSKPGFNEMFMFAVVITNFGTYYQEKGNIFLLMNRFKNNDTVWNFICGKRNSIQRQGVLQVGHKDLISFLSPIKSDELRKIAQLIKNVCSMFL